MEQTVENTTMNLKKMENLPVIDPVNPSRKIPEKEEKWLRELRTYEFQNLEEPGLQNKFVYGNAKNKHTFILFHGGKYKLPRFIARHVESKSTPKWEWRPTGTGQLQKQLVSTKSRFQMREIYE